MGQCLGKNASASEVDRKLSVFVSEANNLPSQEHFSSSGLYIADNEKAAIVPTKEQGVKLAVLIQFLEEHHLSHKSTSTGQVCEELVVSMTKDRKCALVEMLRPEYRGNITHFISHAWKTPFYMTASAVISACEEWEAKTGKEAYVWMDVFCINQHKMTAQQYTQAEINQMLKDAVESSESLYACLHPWNQPVYVRRAWCLYEVHAAMECQAQGRKSWGTMGKGGKIMVKGQTRVARNKMKKEEKIKFILPPEAMEQFEKEALSNEFEAIVKALSDLDVRRAEAFKMEDKEMILSSIEKSYGGAQGLNITVSEQLRKWLLNSAKTIVERRRRTNEHSADYARVLVNYGRLLGDQANSFQSKDLDLVERLFQEALEIDQSLLALNEHDDTASSEETLQLRLAVARDTFMLGSCSYWKRNFTRALERFTAAKTLYQTAHGSEAHHDVAKVLTQMGPTYMKLEMWEQAVSSLREASTNLHPNSHELAECLSFLAYVLFKHPSATDEELEEANALREQVLAINLEVFGEEHPNVAMALFQLARGCAAVDDYSKAAEYFDRATKIYGKIFGEEHEKTRKMEQRYISAKSAASAKDEVARKQRAKSGKARAESIHDRVVTFLPTQASSKMLLTHPAEDD